MESYFLSDLHLKSINERNGQILLRFLRSLEKKTQVRLFFLGDIFDLWISGHDIFKKKYAELLASLENFRTQKDNEIYFFEGNHDLHIHPYWRDELGAFVYTDPQYFFLEGTTVRLEHGDLINLQDKTYLRLRKFLRHPWVEKLGHEIPGAFWQHLGEAWSAQSRKRSNSYREKNQGPLVQMIREHAHRAYNEKEFELIVTGHMHVRDDFEFLVNSKTVRSINLGSWMDDAKVLRLSQQKLEWITLT